MHRLKHVEKEREALDGAKSEAEAHVAKERALLADRSLLFQVFLADAQGVCARVARSKAELEAKLGSEREKHASYTAALADTEARFAAAAKEHAAITAELEKASADFKEFERKDVKAREELKYAKSKAKKADEKATADGARRAELEARAAALAGELPGLEASRDASERALAAEEAKLEALLEGLRDELAGLGAQLGSVEGELAPWDARTATAQAAADVARAERDLLASKAEAATRRAAAARAGAKEADAGADAAAKEHAAATSEAAAADKAAASARAEEKAARGEEAAARAKLGGSRARMEASRAAASDASRSGATLAALRSAKASGAIPGLVGRLGDLGCVGAEYDVAASVAGGAALDHIVVETTSDAVAGVELLRKHSLGTATFLILDKQRAEAVAAAAAPPPTDLPPGALRLLDLVRPAEARLRVAFYAAVRSTLVATDLEAASQLASAPSRPRVVTLAGELIESSGTLSGGGARPRGGRLRVGTAPPRPAQGDAAAAEAELKAATSEWEAATGAAAKGAAAAEAASARGAAAEAASAAATRRAAKLALAVTSLRAKAEDLRRQQAALDGACAVDAKDAARSLELRAELDAAVAALATAASGAAGLRAKAAQLRKAMEDAGGLRLKNCRAAVARLRADIEAAGGEAATKRATAAAASKAAAKLGAAAEEAAAERSALAADLLVRKAALKELEDKAMDVSNHYTETQALQEGAAASLGSLRDAHSDAKKNVAIIRSVELEIAAKLEDLQREGEKTGDKAKTFERKLAAVRREIQEADSLPALPPLFSDEEVAAANQEAVFEARWGTHIPTTQYLSHSPVASRPRSESRCWRRSWRPRGPTWRRSRRGRRRRRSTRSAPRSCGCAPTRATPRAPRTTRCASAASTSSWRASTPSR